MVHKLQGFYCPHHVQNHSGGPKLMSSKIIITLRNKKKINVIYEECVCRGEPSIGIITNSVLNHNSNVIYDEYVSRGTPSIEIITNSGLIYDVKLGHYFL